MSREARDRYDCAVCGQNIHFEEFHSYESCVLYKLDFHPERLTDTDKRQVHERGVDAMRERVRAKVLL